jgi:2-polyprenyl-6-methoxyphenol hydroxylase-like FAD-dependent oxidoreductase
VIFDESAQNHVCIVGAGPAGVVLALLLARQGIPVTLLEGQADFDRDFRGDTLHASSLEIFNQLGLAESILKLSLGKLEKLQFDSADSSIIIAEFTSLDTAYPYVALIPQEQLLNFLTEEAKKLPNYRLLMNAKVTDLIREENQTRGVVYKHEGQEKKISAYLTIGADGRGSTVRQKAGIKLGKTSPPMDVIWFKLPRDLDNVLGKAAEIRFGSGTMLVMIDRGDEWQMGFVVIKGSYKKLRESGMESFHNELLKLVPELKKSISVLKDWSQCAILSVVTGRVDQWYQPGLLLIGDAAHVMSPVGGVGINYAIHDAVAVANLLTEPLITGNVTESNLAKVQQQRERPIQFIQTVQAFIQKRIIASALKTDKPFQPPLPMRVMSNFSFFRKIMARVIAYGLRPEILKNV